MKTSWANFFFCRLVKKEKRRRAGERASLLTYKYGNDIICIGGRIHKTNTKIAEEVVTFFGVAMVEWAGDDAGGQNKRDAGGQNTRDAGGQNETKWWHQLWVCKGFFVRKKKGLWSTASIKDRTLTSRRQLKSISLDSGTSQVFSPCTNKPLTYWVWV